MKTIRLLILSILLTSLSACDKETILSSATINGYPYERKVRNNVFGPTPSDFIVFYETLNYGEYKITLSPIDSKQPTYCICIYIQGCGDNFAVGHTLKLGNPSNITQLLSSVSNNEAQDISRYIPKGYDGIAFCAEVNGNEYTNIRELKGILEISNYDSMTDIFECKFILKNDDNPPLSINGGYMKVTKTHISKKQM